MRWFLNLSIKYKLLIMLSVSSIIPVLILGVYAYDIGAKAIQTEAVYAAQIALNRIASNLELNLYQIDSFSTMVTQSQNVRMLLTDSDGLSDEDRTAIAYELSDAQKHVSTPFKAMIITAEGDYIYNFNWPRESVETAVEQITTEDWFLHGNMYDSTLHFLDLRESYIPDFEAQEHYYFYRSILDEDRNFLGVLLVDLNAYTFDRQLTMNIDSEQDSILLTDKNGKIISLTDPENHTLEQILANTSMEVEAEAALQILPWSVYFLREEGASGQSMEQLIPFTVMLVLVVMLVEYGLFRFFDRSISRPLTELCDTLVALPQNDFQVPVLDGYAQDEIGILARGVGEMSVKIQQSIQTIKEEERQMEQLEFLMLQAQINLHFLYNSLNSIMLIAEFMGCDNIRHAIACLIKLLQYSIDNFDNEITIQEEIDYLKSYVDLNNIRFKNKLKFVYDIPEELRQQRIIKFLFQPLVENAIVHGLRGKTGIGTVRLQIRQVEETLVCVVEDNGVGMSTEELENIWKNQDMPEYDRLHIGIPNIDKRIKLVYGEEYGLQIESQPEKGTYVKLTISSVGRRSDENPDCR